MTSGTQSDQPPAPPSIVCLVGSTGTGKTAAALALCEAFRGSVINCDSRQIFAGLPLVTAQPSPEERARCPHLLYGSLPTCASLSAGEFADLAREAISETLDQGRLPLLVGGTGLYLRALITGLAEIPEIPAAVRQAVLERLERQGAPALHAELARVDPRAAERIHPNDRQRISRALEVWQATGTSLSEWHDRQALGAASEPRYRALILGLTRPREELDVRLEARIGEMLRGGALEEALAAYALCPDLDASVWSGIGCREALDAALGHVTLEEAAARWLKRTRAYARRQMTWFGNDPAVRWFAPEDADAMLAAVGEFLAGVEDAG